MTKDQHKIYFDWLGKRLGYKEMDDWYKLTSEEVKENGGGGLLNKCDNSLAQMVRSVYPDHSWETLRFGTKRPLFKKREI